MTDDPFNQKFVKLSREKQEKYHKYFGSYEWTEFRPTEHDILKRKIGYAFYGCATFQKNENVIYNEEQRKFIDNMFQLMLMTKKEHRDQDNIWVSFVCVCCRIDEQFTEISVIRVPKYDARCTVNVDMFIDGDFRVYKNWQDYLENNQLPACYMCYPRGGKYSDHGDQLQLCRGESPEAKPETKILKFLDLAAPQIQSFVSCRGQSSSFSAALGKLAINLASTGYIVYRKTEELRDRKDHMQSTGLDNEESRNCYVEIMSSTLCAASSYADAAIAKSTQNGKPMNKAKQVAFKSIKGAYCFSNGLRIANGIANIVQKSKEGNNLSKLDLLEVISSVLFFTDCVIDECQVFKLINEANNKNTKILDEVTNKAMAYSSIQDKIRNVNKYCQIVTSVAIILIDKQKILKNIWDSWNNEMNYVIKKLDKFFGNYEPGNVYGKGGSGYYFAKTNPDFLDTVVMTFIAEASRFFKSLGISSRPISRSDVTHDNSQNGISQNNATQRNDQHDAYTDAVMKISKKFADEQHCESPGDFLRYLRFTCKFVRRECLRQKRKHKKLIRRSKKFSPSTTVGRVYGIQTNRIQYFLKELMEDFQIGNGFLKLIQAYHDQTTIAADDETFNVGGFSYIAIENEEGRAPDGWFNRQQYFGKAEQLVGEEVNEINVAIDDDGGTTIMVVREAEKIIKVATMKEANGKISGIAIMLHNCS